MELLAIRLAHQEAMGKSLVIPLAGEGQGEGAERGQYIDHIVPLHHPVKPILAMGAWLKNTVCIAQGRQAVVSKCVGDLDSAEACYAHEETARALLEMLDEKPAAIAHDLHPDFFSSRLAARLASELNVPLLAVQHHHAHIAAVVAEHGVTGPVLGLALDGVGLGSDGGVWGGELLQVEGAEFQRLGCLRPLPLPGGDRAAREPWRMAAAVLHELGRDAQIAQRFFDQPAAGMVATMLQRNLNCPRTSSMGRVFDAAASLLGLCQKMEFEAQAAIALEQAAMRYINVHGMPSPMAGGWLLDDAGCLTTVESITSKPLPASPCTRKEYAGGCPAAPQRPFRSQGRSRLSPPPDKGELEGVVLDLLPLLGKLAGPIEAEQGAAIFHATLIGALADWALRVSQRTGIKTIACGGGCFFNKLLTVGLRERLEQAGLKVLFPEAIPPGDTAIALGQAWVAAHL